MIQSDSLTYLLSNGLVRVSKSFYWNISLDCCANIFRPIKALPALRLAFPVPPVRFLGLSDSVGSESLPGDWTAWTVETRVREASCVKRAIRRCWTGEPRANRRTSERPKGLRRSPTGRRRIRGSGPVTGSSDTSVSSGVSSCELRTLPVESLNFNDSIVQIWHGQLCKNILALVLCVGFAFLASPLSPSPRTSSVRASPRSLRTASLS